MNSILDQEITDGENLYRAVPNIPTHWKPELDIPSSAIFKDSKGVSVDRAGERNEHEITGTFKERFENLKAIVKITAGQCREIGTFPVYEPEEENIYHSLIKESAERIQINSSKAKKLRDKASIVFVNKQQ